MTDDQTPAQPGKPPIGGPLRPEQVPPGFPDPNAPKLVFGPGSPQTGGPPQQPGQPQQNGQQPPNDRQQGSQHPGDRSPRSEPPQQQRSTPPTGAPAPVGAPNQPWQQNARLTVQQPFGQQQPGQQTHPQPPFRPAPPFGAPQQFGPGQPQQPGRPGQAGQVQPGQPYQGQVQPGRPGQPHPGQPHPGQPHPGQAQVPFRPGLEYGNTTGQHPFTPAPAPKPKRKPLGRKLWTGVVIGAVAASLIAVPLTLLSVGRLFTPMLDTGSVQAGVAKVLKDDFGLADVEKVECPSDQPAVAGTQFECTFSYNTKSYPVAVEVINDQGQYRVGIDAPK